MISSAGSVIACAPVWPPTRTAAQAATAAQALKTTAVSIHEAIMVHLVSWGAAR